MCVPWQILWILQFPHAVALTLVRWAICVFFIRTFFTNMFSKLRCIGNFRPIPPPATVPRRLRYSCSCQC